MKMKPKPREIKRLAEKPLVCTDCGEEMDGIMPNYGEPEIGYNLCYRCYEHQRMTEE